MRRLIDNINDFVAAWNAAKSAEQAASVFGLTTQQAIVQASKFRGQGFEVKKFSGNPTFLKCKHCGKVFQTYPSEVKNGRAYCSQKCYAPHVAAHIATHGESRTRLHQIWCHMKTRCLCETSPSFKYYGARGITVCQEWQDSFEAFRDWALANGYAETLEIDRRDTNGNYDPGNCRWATRSQQMRNTRKRCNAKTSKYKGVSRHSQNGTWICQVVGRKGKKTSYAGTFATEEEAAREYDRIVKAEFGNFVHLNFPEQGGSECFVFQEKSTNKF